MCTGDLAGGKLCASRHVCARERHLEGGELHLDEKHGHGEAILCRLWGLQEGPNALLRGKGRVVFRIKEGWGNSLHAGGGQRWPGKAGVVCGGGGAGVGGVPWSPIRSFTAHSATSLILDIRFQVRAILWVLGAG